MLATDLGNGLHFGGSIGVDLHRRTTEGFLLGALYTPSSFAVDPVQLRLKGGGPTCERSPLET